MNAFFAKQDLNKHVTEVVYYVIFLKNKLFNF